MKVYFYDEITKEFTMSADALKDQLESKIQGKDVWLLPANATFDEPLPSKDGYKVVYNNGWKYEKLPEPEVTPEPTLDELKLLKRAEINSARDRTEQGGFEYLGKVFDSDMISCQRISTAAQAMAFAQEETAIVWTCQDNTTISLNKTQLAGLVAALVMHSNECHQKATALKAEVEKAKTKEELEKITWSRKD